MTNITGTSGNDMLTGTSGDDLIQGLDGNDNLSGGLGNDRLEGGSGEDSLDGGEGNDLLIGGDDQDTLYDNRGGDEEFVGGAGDDSITISRFAGAAASVNVMDGGAGNDRLGVYDDSRASTFNVSGGDGNDRFWLAGAAVITVDAGAGDDLVELDGASGAVSIALGSGGVDRVRVTGASLNMVGGSIHLTAFDSGDSLDLAEHLNLHLANWDARTNPFATGHLRLVQSGADALLQVDWNGGADNYVTFVTFAATSASSLTAFNLGGWGSDGSVPPGATLVGGAGEDQLSGGAGGDLIQGLGGFDRIYGAAGDDRLEGGGAEDWIYGGLGDDIIEGGDGDDSLYGDLRGADILRGGEGNDHLRADRVRSETGWIELDGGGGDDSLWALGYEPQVFLPPVLTRFRLIGGEGADTIFIYRATEAEVDAGAGNDVVTLDTFTDARITLGAGSDRLTLDALRGYFYDDRSFVVTDFEAGPAGDRLDWTAYLQDALPSWDRISNPFGTYLRLVQSGADTLVQLSRSGNESDFFTLITFENVQASALGQFNMGGYPPDGSPPAGIVLVGSADPDQLTGEGGGDILYGLGANDLLKGGSGDDWLFGGDGNDHLVGELGSDQMEGGANSDFLEDRSDGDDNMYGGDGGDTLYVERNGTLASILYLDGGAGADSLSYIAQYFQVAAVTLTMLGGEGNDRITVNGRANAVINAGAGDDLLFLGTQVGHRDVTLGQGSDSIELWAYNGIGGTVTVTDFQVGDAGDRLDLDAWFSFALTGWDGAQNPFSAGYARLVESGGSTLLQVDQDGGGNAYSTLVTLSGVSALYLTSANLGGFDPVTRGTPGADQMTGTGASDRLDGGAGNDLFLLQGGGDDGALGGAGSDIFYFGSAFTGADRADGGADRDVVILQGHYALTLSSTNLAGIESISLQSGARTTWGDTANNFYDYNLTMADANASGGQQLIVNAQSLRAGEDFSFDGSAESGDGTFLVYGGHGIDTLRGGGGNDVFFFEGTRWGAGDSVDGGSGRDALVISAGNGLTHIEFGANALTGIESISLNARFATDPNARPSYELVLSNGNVAAGGTLIVNGSSLADPLQTMSVDAGAVRNGTLILLGGAGNDVLTGGFGGDTLTGGDGADVLQGGEGIDRLTGGAGADTFRYASQYDATPQFPDQILDFVSGTDRIDLSAIDADQLAAGDQAFHWIGSNAFAGTGASSAGELRAYEHEGSWFVEGDMDGNGAADLVIRLATLPAPVVQSDFLL